MLGRSPDRNRAINESARSSIGSRPSDEGVADASAVMIEASFRFRVDSKLAKSAAHIRQDVLEPDQSPRVALAGGRFVEAKHLRGLSVGKLLEVPQGEDLTVDRVEVV